VRQGVIFGDLHNPTVGLPRQIFSRRIDVARRSEGRQQGFEEFDLAAVCVCGTSNTSGCLAATSARRRPKPYSAWAAAELGCNNSTPSGRRNSSSRCRPEGAPGCRRRQEEGNALVTTATTNSTSIPDVLAKTRSGPTAAHSACQQPGAKGNERHETGLQLRTRADGQIGRLERENVRTQVNDDLSGPKGPRLQLHRVLLDHLDGLTNRRWVADLDDRDNRRGGGDDRIGGRGEVFTVCGISIVSDTWQLEQ